MSLGFGYRMDNGGNRLIRMFVQDRPALARNADDGWSEPAASTAMTGEDVRVLDALLAAQARHLRRIALELLDE